MISNRGEARRRGLRMAAQIALVGGILGAGTAYSRADELPVKGSAESGGATATRAGDVVTASDGLGDRLRMPLGGIGGCGCAPCWGPPAPPPMQAELFALFEEQAA